MINVLIVDDDMATVEVVRNTVHWEQLGVSSVDKAYNIEQAKKILLSKNIDLVISDVEMPMGSGLDLLRWFRFVVIIDPIFFRAFFNSAISSSIPFFKEVSLSKSAIYNLKRLILIPFFIFS